MRDGLDRCLACFWMLCVAAYGTLEPNGDRTGRWYRSPRESGHGLSPGRRLHARRPTRREQPTTSPFPAPNRAGSPPWPQIDARPHTPRPAAPRPAKAPPRPSMSAGSRDPTRGFRPRPGPARRHVASPPGGAIPQRRTPGRTPPRRRDAPTTDAHRRRLVAPIDRSIHFATRRTYNVSTIARTFARPASASAESSDASTGSRRSVRRGRPYGIHA